MKIAPSLRPRCPFCRIVSRNNPRRKGGSRKRIVCPKDPTHKAAQPPSAMA